MSIKKLSKHTSRIAAVQVMYQKDITDADLDKISNNFIVHYVNKEDAYNDINLSFYKRLLNHFSETDSLDKIIAENLDGDTHATLNNSIIKSIVRVALIEMIFANTDIPIIINEFVEIARDFVDEKGVKFVNAILDKISKKVERQCLAKA